MLLSLIVPVFNEEDTVAVAVQNLLAVDFDTDVEIIVVNDGSTDNTSSILESIVDERIHVVELPNNQGKGAAVRFGISNSSGDYVIIYDADLEYDPAEIPTLLQEAISKHFDVVLGARVFGSHSAFSFWYVMGNRITTLFVNMMFNSYVADIHTCYKLVSRQALKRITLKSNGFDFDTELICKLLKAGYRPFEIPISYRARSREEGKKITWRDGVTAITTTLRVKLGLL